MTDNIFTQRAEVAQTVRALSLDIQNTLANAVSDGLFPDGLTVPLDTVNKIVIYYLLATPDITPIEDANE